MSDANTFLTLAALPISFANSPTLSDWSLPDLTDAPDSQTPLTPPHLTPYLISKEQWAQTKCSIGWDPVVDPEAWSPPKKRAPYPGPHIIIPFSLFNTIYSIPNAVGLIAERLADTNEEESTLFECLNELRHSHQDIWTHWSTLHAPDKGTKLETTFHQSRMISCAQRIEDTAQSLFSALCGLGFINDIHDILENLGVITKVTLRKPQIYMDDDGSQLAIRTRRRKPRKCYGCGEKGHIRRNCHKGSNAICAFCNQIDPRHVPQNCKARPSTWYDYKPRHRRHEWDRV